MCRSRIQSLAARLSICIASGLIMTACAQSVSNKVEWRNSAGRATVRVENRYLGDLHIYLVNHGTRYRIGVISSLSEASFSIPMSVVVDSDIQFLAVSVAEGHTHQSEFVAIKQGSVIALTIQPTGNLSSLILRR